MAEERIPIIQVKDLYKIYKVGESRVHALDGVDFTVYKGEFCAIVGPSGSGKSTLLNMLAGLEKPSKGQIIIDKIHIEKMTENQLVAFRRQKVGFIFQSYNLLQTLNAVENVALPLSFRGIPRRERNETAKKYLKMVGLEKQMKHMANAMSGGQQQRVGIARALAVKPRIIFADEPTGNLDSKTTLEILRLLQQIVRDQGLTLIMVTHDNNLASYADRQFRIVDGKIVKIIERQQAPQDPEDGADEGREAPAADSETGTGEPETSDLTKIGVVEEPKAGASPAAGGDRPETCILSETGVGEPGTSVSVKVDSVEEPKAGVSSEAGPEGLKSRVQSWTDSEDRKSYASPAADPEGRLSEAPGNRPETGSEVPESRVSPEDQVHPDSAGEPNWDF